MELPEVSKQDLDVAKSLMLEFCSNPSKMNLLGSYPYLVNCLFSYSWKMLTINKVQFRDSSIVYEFPKPKKFENDSMYNQCELINSYLVYKGINVNRLDLSIFVNIRNRLVHEPKFINSFDKNKAIVLPSIEEMKKISNLFYNSDICADYITAIIKFYKDSKRNKKKNKEEEKSKLYGTLPDIINSGLNKTQPCQDFMEQLMSQNKE